MSGEGTGMLGPCGLLVVLAGCAIAAAAADPAVAQRERPRPEVLWRAYPLQESPVRASVPEPRPRRAQPAKASGGSSARPTDVLGAVAGGVLLAAGGLALLRLRRRRPAPALRAPLPPPHLANGRPSRSPPELAAATPTPETCWIVCWRGAGQAIFYAITRDRDGRQRVIDESPVFTATPNSPLVLDGAAFEALEALASRLSNDGWEAAAPAGALGASWHAQEFRR
jgi:hypothetical protein